jgi:WS/DGAT/MGAT family acyltransferase
VTVIEGRQDGRIGFYTNIHHAVVDGQAGVELMRTLFDSTRRPRRRAAAARGRGRAEHPWAGQVIADGLRHDVEQYWKLVRNLPAMAKALARSRGSGIRGAAPRRPGLGPQTPLNVAIDAERGFATASIPLAAVREIAAAHGASVNDVVLAVCAGALRRYLGRRGGVPDEPLVAGMPVSLRGPGKVELTTQATMTRVDLATDIADPVRRLRAIRDATGAAKAAVSRTKSLVPMDFPTIGVPWLLHGLAAVYGRPSVANRVPRVVNLVVSNVPGPPQPMYLAGARVVHHWPLSIVGHGLGLNVTVESYAGMLEFGVTTARAAVARPRAIADGLVASFEQLRRRSRGK